MLVVLAFWFIVTSLGIFIAVSLERDYKKCEEKAKSEHEQIKRLIKEKNRKQYLKRKHYINKTTHSVKR